MENSKVISIDLENITFDNGAIMYSTMGIIVAI